jgi:hypothetical protein
MESPIMPPYYRKVFHKGTGIFITTSQLGNVTMPMVIAKTWPYNFAIALKPVPPLLAEGCLLAQPVERLLWKEQTFKIHKSAAIFDPQRTLGTLPS